MKRICLKEDMSFAPKETELDYSDPIIGAQFYSYSNPPNHTKLFFLKEDLQLFIDAGIVEDVGEKEWTDKDMSDYGAYVVHNMEKQHFLNNPLILFSWYKDNVLDKRK